MSQSLVVIAVTCTLRCFLLVALSLEQIVVQLCRPLVLFPSFLNPNMQTRFIQLSSRSSNLYMLDSHTALTVTFMKGRMFGRCERRDRDSQQLRWHLFCATIHQDYIEWEFCEWQIVLCWTGHGIHTWLHQWVDCTTPQSWVCWFWNQGRFPSWCLGCVLLDSAMQASWPIDNNQQFEATRYHSFLPCSFWCADMVASHRGNAEFLICRKCQNAKARTSPVDLHQSTRPHDLFHCLITLFDESILMVSSSVIVELLLKQIPDSLGSAQFSSLIHEDITIFHVILYIFLEPPSQSCYRWRLWLSAHAVY